MKIEFEDNKGVKFRHILEGDLFESTGRDKYYIKTYAMTAEGGEVENALNVESGRFTRFEADDDVFPVKAKIVISE